MTVLEKKEDIKMFFAMGATPTLIKQIFLLEGIIVAFTGSGILTNLYWGAVTE